MKKFIALFILAALVLSLAGCAGLAKKPGGDNAADSSTPAPSPTPDMSDILNASASNAKTASETHVPPASPSDAQVQLDQAAYETAQQYVGRSVQELYAAIGEPSQSPVYGPSCLQADAEDGLLTYNGFSVWTVRSQSAETVHEVYLNE